jgi:PKHD-type hydroxylase
MVYDSNGDKKEGTRKCSYASIELDDRIKFLYDKIAVVSRVLNHRSYNFKLDGFCEPMQYLQYDSLIEAHYGAHIDCGPLNVPPRKLSVVLQLTDPSEYEGGDLEIITSDEPVKVPKKRGALILFPSFRLHRVTPVTKGLRKTIVGWIAGPSFR